MKESLRLGAMPKGTEEYKEQRSLIASAWHRIDPSLAELQSVTARETKRTTRDALHGRLCEIQRQVDKNPNSIKEPYISWKVAIDGVIDWLDSWAK